MRKTTLILLMSSLFSLPNFTLANEQAELDQALKQLEAAKHALYRAQVQARSTNVKDRFYFDYIKARQDIDLVRSGISHYLNNERAQPRDPRQIRTLSGQYGKIRGE